MAERSSFAEGEPSALPDHTPFPVEDETSSFISPRAPYLAQENPGMTESPRDSFMHATPNDSGMLLANKSEEYAQEDPIPKQAPAPRAKRRTWLFVVLALLGLIIVVLAVILPIVFTVIKPKNHKSTSTQPSSSSQNPTASAAPTSSGGGSGTSPKSAAAITGGDGSTITASDGSTFTYSNSFGGICESSLASPRILHMESASLMVYLVAQTAHGSEFYF